MSAWSALWTRAEAEEAVAYIEAEGQGRVPKFRFTPVEKVLFVGVAGLAYAAPAAVVGYAVGRVVGRGSSA